MPACFMNLGCESHHSCVSELRLFSYALCYGLQTWSKCSLIIINYIISMMVYSPENNYQNPGDREWTDEVDEGDEWLQASENDGFDLFAPSLPPVPDVHSRIRRQVSDQINRPVSNDFDPKEVIQAFQESFTPVMVLTIIIFLLVALVLPLMFSTEYLFLRRNKVFPEKQKQEPEEFFLSATQSTQLALDDDNDDIMKDLRPDELQFTVTEPRSIPAEINPRYDPTGLETHQKPPRPSDADPINPAIGRVPSILRLPYQKPEKHPETSKPSYLEGEVTVQKRPKKVIKVASVHSQTIRDPTSLSQGKAKEKPNDTPVSKQEKVKDIPFVISIPSNSEVDFEVEETPKARDPDPSDQSVLDLEQNLPKQDPLPGTSRATDERKGPKNGRKKCQGKILVGNSTRFKSGGCMPKDAKRKTNQDLTGPHPCTCPFPQNEGSRSKRGIKDLTWFQFLEYAQADGGWYTEEEAQESQQNEDNDTTRNKDKKKEDKKYCGKDND